MRLFITFMAILFSIALAACGGGGSSSGGGGSSSTLSGTAATGLPIVGTVYAVDSTGRQSAPTTTSSAGVYTLDVAGLTAPFILRIVGTSNGQPVALNSIATAANTTVNITPLTDLIVSTASGRPANKELVDLCTPTSGGSTAPAGCIAALAAATSGTKLADAVTFVRAIIAPLNTGNTDPLTGSFAANGTGFDALLDRIVVTPADQGSLMATVTLIGTNQTIGTVTLPAGGTGTVTTTPNPPSSTDVGNADAAVTVLSEINACLSSFNALYAGSTPTSAQVDPFIDAAFRLQQSVDKTAVVNLLSSNTDIFTSGFNLKAVRLSKLDMSPFSSAELTTLQGSTSATAFRDVLLARANNASPILANGSGNPTAAWVVTSPRGKPGMDWKFVKGAAYAGCTAGWKLAGNPHPDMHMQARTQRSYNAGTGAFDFSQMLPFHVNGASITAEGLGIDTVVVGGPGISQYSGNSSSPVGAAMRLTLTNPGGLYDFWQIGNGTTFYGISEALKTCEAVAAAGASAGTPCIDTSQIAPGAIYGWVFKAAGTPVLAFPHQVNVLPLGIAFAQANQTNLFASITPNPNGTITNLNSAISTNSGNLDGLITFNYTYGSAYGATMDHCRIHLTDAGYSPVMIAEVKAASNSTSCTFNSANLNSGSLTATGAATHGFAVTGTEALGNQLVTSYPIPN